MKSYTKGILVGISIVLGALLLMGLTESSEEVGRYQVSITNRGDSWGIFETIIDTKTGKIISRERIPVGNYE